MSWEESLARELDDLKIRGRLRQLRELTGRPDTEIVLDGRVLTNFSSNDYLGLAGDGERFADIAGEGIKRVGVGVGGSRLIAGTPEPQRQLEARLADWKGTSSALLFPSGYQANVGLLPCLCGPQDLILSDELNHASIIDGCRLSRATVRIYRHLDLGHLEVLLRETAPAHRRTVVVSESIFSMDADEVDLNRWMDLAKGYGALTYLDEAHAIGVRGDEGQGLATGDQVDVMLGTFGKALGGAGAFVCTSDLVAQWIWNRCRSFVFSTGVSSIASLASLAALEFIRSPEGQLRRQHLQQNINYFCSALERLQLTPRRSHIIPLRVRSGTDEEAMELTGRLFEQGVYAQAIRPPTVPEGTARLRWTLMANHSRAQLDRAIDALASVRSYLS